MKNNLSVIHHSSFRIHHSSFPPATAGGTDLRIDAVTPERWQQVSELFEAVLAHAPTCAPHTSQMLARAMWSYNMKFIRCSSRMSKQMD